MKEGLSERKREGEFGDKKREETKYSKKGASRKMSLVNLEMHSCLHSKVLSGIYSAF